MGHNKLSIQNDALPSTPRLVNLDFTDHPFNIIDCNVFKFGLYAILSWDNGPITFSNVKINDRPKKCSHITMKCSPNFMQYPRGANSSSIISLSKTPSQFKPLLNERNS